MIDLRSDTVTRPTAAMRRAMAEAEVGDDVYGEDPTVNRLEEEAARLVGKEAALFVASGTMGNQLAVMTHTRRGDEVIVEAESHIYYYEVGGLAALSGVQPLAIPGQNGILTSKDVEAALRPENIHFPRPRLLCLENTHNRGGGTVLSVEQTRALAEVARRAGMKVHLDGARIFNAAVFLGVTARELAEPADSVMFCLSKGLGAPVGSILAGSAAFVEAARKNRKLLGGGMRQAGILAAAGLLALEMVSCLEEDHQKARVLAEGLAEIPGITLDLNLVQTNIVRFDVAGTGLSAPDLVARLKDEGVLANAVGTTKVRMVTHRDVSGIDIKRALRILAAVVSN